MKTYNIKHKFIKIVLLSATIFLGSCENYLDVAPEVQISEQDIFSTFPRFQGWMENIYQCMYDFSKADRNISQWNWSNDVFENNTLLMQYTMERGDYLGEQGRFGYHWRPVNNTGNSVYNSGGSKRDFWNYGWYGIKLTNIAIDKINEMQGTEEERNLILGQAYFFRAMYHHDIMRDWGGIPYLDKTYSPQDNPKLPRLSYKDAALLVAKDLEKAIELLPNDWDETQAGQRTLGSNRGRVTKGVAYAYLGWNYLWLSSPLVYGLETGAPNSDVYNKEYAKKAAIAFNEVIKLADQGYYGLYTWSEYYMNFWRLDGSTPRGKEWIWGNPNYGNSRNDYGECLLTDHGGVAGSISPVSLEMTQEFGMANGLPIDEPGSGFDPMHPFTNRDPRFNYCITVDRDKILFYTTAYPASTYAQYYVGGRHRSQVKTGFSHKKFLGKGCNNKDNKWSNNYYWHVPYIRLAAVYLYYAEAVNEGYDGPSGSVPDGLTAVQAINIVRSRAQVPDLDSRFLTKDAFRGAIRNEINVETAFEGHRWYDLRRWYLHHLLKYRQKSALNFDQNWTYFTPQLLVTMVFQQKHYWYPFREADISLYKEFYQNPGW